MTELREGVCEALDVACSVIKEKETHRRGKVSENIIWRSTERRQRVKFSKRTKFAVTPTITSATTTNETELR